MADFSAAFHAYDGNRTIIRDGTVGAALHQLAKRPPRKRDQALDDALFVDVARTTVLALQVGDCKLAVAVAKRILGHVAQYELGVPGKWTELSVGGIDRLHGEGLRLRASE